MLPELFKQPNSIYHVDNSLPKKIGNEKIIWPVRKNGVLFVAKIFKNFDVNGKSIDKEKSAKHEFDSYLKLSNSAISKFVPAPIELIKGDDGKTNGLLVSWRFGVPISNLYDEVSISKELFNDLRQSVLQLSKGQLFEADALSEENVCYDGSSLWLAELQLKSYPSYSKFKSMVNFYIDTLISDYSNLS
jgi:hypothetical protein